jgi:hypothetical protein
VAHCVSFYDFLIVSLDVCTEAREFSPLRSAYCVLRWKIDCFRQKAAGRVMEVFFVSG